MKLQVVDTQMPSRHDPHQQCHTAQIGHSEKNSVPSVGFIPKPHIPLTYEASIRQFQNGNKLGKFDKVMKKRGQRLGWQND